MGKHEVYMFLKQNKKRKGWSNKEIAEQLDVSVGSVTNATKKLIYDKSIKMVSDYEESRRRYRFKI